MSLASAAVLGSARPAFAEERATGYEAATASADARFVRWVITERRGTDNNSIQVTDLVLTNDCLAILSAASFAADVVSTSGGSARSDDMSEYCRVLIRADQSFEAVLEAADRMSGVGAPRMGEVCGVLGVHCRSVPGFPCGWLHCVAAGDIDVSNAGDS